MLFVFIVFAAGLIPLIVTRAKKAKISEEHYQRRLRGSTIVIIADILFIIGFFVFVNLYTQFLWFANLGYADRFLTVLRFEVVLYLAGFAAAFLFLFFTTRHPLGWLNTRLRHLGSFPMALVLALLLGIWTSGLWPKFLLFFNQVSSDLTEPIFGRSVSYYLFSLPLYSSLIGWLILLFVLAIGVTSLSLYGLAQRSGAQAPDPDWSDRGIRALSSQLLVLLSLPQH